MRALLGLCLFDLAGLEASGAGEDRLGAAVNAGAHALEIGEDKAVGAPGDLAAGAAFGLILAFTGHYLSRKGFFAAVITYFTHH